MALSVFVSFFPLLFTRCSFWKYIVLTSASSLAMCLTYQASSGIFPMAVILLALLSYTCEAHWKKVLQFVIKSALGYVIGLIIFYGIIAESVPSTNYAGTKISPWKFPVNLSNYSYTFYTDMTFVWRAFIAIIIITSGVVLISRRQTKKHLNVLPVLLGISFMYVMSFGAYLFLEKPLFSTRAMYGTGIFISMLMLTIVSQNQSGQQIIGKTAVLGLSWLFFVFSFTYGNCLSEQQKYTDFRMECLASDLAEVAQSENDSDLAEKTQSESDSGLSASSFKIAKKNLVFAGTIGYAESVKNAIREFPIVERNIHVMLSDDYWGRYCILPYYGLEQYYNFPVAGLIEEDLKRFPVTVSNAYHDIYVTDENIYVELNETT